MSFVLISTTVYGKSIETIQTSGDVSAGIEINADGAILMEAETGRVLYEKDADKIASPASITKIMTLILIFDEIKNGNLGYEDMVTTSEHAKSMGGSQVFLETGEQQSVETLIKCIIISSGNDACVTMAEHIAGSEEEFVKRMNERAKNLGMTNTVFLDCCGLNDTMEHHTTARDVALMSRELISKYPEIFNYSTIWMENITHNVNGESKEFTLANTNKLLKQYEYATGLKTGSTSLAKYCLSATAKKDGIQLIAVILGAKDYKARFSEAKKLLEYGYGNISKYTDNENKKIKVKVQNGKENTLTCTKDKNFSYICINDENIGKIKTVKSIHKEIKAPVKKGEMIGKVEYYIDNRKIGESSYLAVKDIRKKGYVDYLKKIWYKYLV
ncbi:MAG: D-alanyl-D-alanine carboxypeptidase [Lachnospiraceae bacterium]|nr:D-alanyl-D-alanine carboxypeptidase [Lachnospiraceae bacterium]